jgi:hypothetical protein
MNRRLLIGALAATAVLGACDEERADINSPDFPTAYGFQLVNAGTTHPRGTARFGVAAAQLDSLQLTLLGLDSLASGVYAVWVGDSLGQSFKRVSGVLRSVRADTTFDADGNPIRTDVPFDIGTVSSFSNGGHNQTLTFRTTRAAAGLDAADPMQHVIVSVETDAAATTPSDVRFLFARRGDAGISGNARSPALIFGNYGPDALSQYRFVNTIRGRGGFRGPVLMITDSLMARPPKGFYYAASVFKIALAGIVPDTTYLGEQRSPYPNRALSQRDADIRITDPENVFDSPYQIRAGQFRVSADTIPGMPSDFPWKEYFTIRVTLQNKAGIEGRMSPNTVAFAPVPTVIWDGSRQ